MERVKVKCGVLHHIKRNTGKMTDCIFAKILHNNIDINLTYDCISKNLIIHEWYRVSKLELNDMIEELKQCFAVMVK